MMTMTTNMATAAGKGDIGTVMISNGNRTEWSPIRSVIIRVITKSDDRAAGVRFVYHDVIGLLNCPITNCSITTWQVN